MSIAPLTERQRRFITEYAKDGNGTQAAIRAGFSPKGASVQSTRLLGYAKIRATIEATRTPALEKAQVTLEGHLNALAALRDRAVELEQISAAVAAETNRGKLAGYYVERSLVATVDLPQVIVE